jgi:hypothetical protein
MQWITSKVFGQPWDSLEDVCWIYRIYTVDSTYSSTGYHLVRVISCCCCSRLRVYLPSCQQLISLPIPYPVQVVLPALECLAIPEGLLVLLFLEVLVDPGLEICKVVVY